MQAERVSTTTPSEIDESSDPDLDPTNEASAWGRRTGWRRLIPTYAFDGMIGALVFAVVSFLPSLLPRSGLFQGLITGVTAATGYGIGLVVGWFWREIANRDPRPTQRRSWLILGGVAAFLLIYIVIRSQGWQGQLRDLMGVPTPGPAWIVIMPVVAVVVFWLVIAIARVFRWLFRKASSLLSRWIGERGARVIGFAIAAFVALTIATGVIWDSFITTADQIFSVRNGITAEGIVEPTAPTRSGSPDSLVSWESLGREGRAFIGQGPDAAEITKVTDREAVEPIRAYAGLESADTTEARARLAVDDLERAGGFKRDALVVATTTGSGWIDQASVNSVEYLSSGNSATVAIQYSYLPSWISYLVDQQRAREAGRELFDAVYARWLDLPADDRPKLYVFGESLGSFGGEAAFSGEYDMRNRTDGVVFAGPPNFNTLWSEFTRNREAGTPEILPVFRDGRTVRFVSDPSGEIPPADKPWTGSRVIYLQHSSDPIVWWSPDLILNEPDWMEEPRGDDVLDSVVWAPFVTFWGITVDQFNSTSVPSGHGHVYSQEYVDAWNQVFQDTTWTPAQLAELRDVVGGTES
jgi:uncharacterized membrane protein